MKAYFFFLPFLSGDCVSAEAATLFTVLDVFLSRRSLLALDATFLDVFSLRAKSDSKFTFNKNDKKYKKT